MPNIEYELNEKIHAIIINPYLTWEDFCTNCDLIKKYNIKNISSCLNYLADLKNCLSNYEVNIKKETIKQFIINNLKIKSLYQLKVWNQDF